MSVTAVPAEPDELGVDSTIARYLDIPPDQSHSLVQSIALRVAREIIEGAIPPGATLDSITLADRFGTSRTPVREALISLDHAGLVVVQPRRRPRVYDPSPAQVAEIYELRAELHALVARKVVRNATAEQLDELGRELDRMRAAAAAGDHVRFFWANVRFHDLMMLAAGDATLQRTVEGLGVQVLGLRRLGASLPGRVERACHDNERLYTALREREEDIAAIVARKLILRALEGLLTLLTERGAS